MSKLQEIINGWGNYVFPNEKMEEIAKTRMSICLDCENLKKTNTCALCGCFMPAKVRSEKSKCNINKW